MKTNKQIQNYLSIYDTNKFDVEIKELTKFLYNNKKITYEDYLSIFSIQNDYKRSKAIFAVLNKYKNDFHPTTIKKIERTMFLIELFYFKKLKIISKRKNDHIVLFFILNKKFKKRTIFYIKITDRLLLVRIQDKKKNNFWLHKEIYLFWGCQADKIKAYCNNKTLKIIIPIINKQHKKIPIIYRHKLKPEPKPDKSEGNGMVFTTIAATVSI